MNKRKMNWDLISFGRFFRIIIALLLVVNLFLTQTSFYFSWNHNTSTYEDLTKAPLETESETDSSNEKEESKKTGEDFTAPTLTFQNSFVIHPAVTDMAHFLSFPNYHMGLITPPPEHNLI